MIAEVWLVCFLACLPCQLGADHAPPLVDPVAALAIYGTTFPANREAELATPPPSTIEGEEEGKWPLLIFSHGVGTSRLMYSGICGELASRGYVRLLFIHVFSEGAH